MNPALLVGVGGVAGAIARHLVGERIDERVGYGPLDTLAVNVIGSLLLGGILAAPPTLVATDLQLLLGTGFCGAFTTFSTFAFETVRLVETGRRKRAAITGVANLVGSIAAVLLGAGLMALFT